MQSDEPPTSTPLGLMTDDVVFLVPGRPPMRKADFASAAKAQPGRDAPTIDGTSDIQEIRTHPRQEVTKALQVSRGRPASAGDSGTPLAKKLGVREGSRMLLVGAPGDYARLLDPLPRAVEFAGRAGPEVDIVHVFTASKEELKEHLAMLRKALRPDAAVWVSWPKKAGRIASTVTEDTIRSVALPLGLVDVKVCAVSEVWSGLKLVVRRELR